MKKTIVKKSQLLNLLTNKKVFIQGFRPYANCKNNKLSKNWFSFLGVFFYKFGAKGVSFKDLDACYVDEDYLEWAISFVKETENDYLTDVKKELFKTLKSEKEVSPYYWLYLAELWVYDLEDTVPDHLDEAQAADYVKAELYSFVQAYFPETLDISASTLEPYENYLLAEEQEDENAYRFTEVDTDYGDEPFDFSDDYEEDEEDDYDYEDENGSGNYTPW